MSGLDLKYDGIVYQHAGELLLDLDETRDIRWRCMENYWNSLSSFVFGQVFGGYQIAPGEEREGDVVPKPMLPLFQGGPSPGEALLTQYFPGKRRFKVRSTNLPSIETLITDPSDPGHLKDALGRLTRIVRTPHAISWRQHLIREVYLSFKPKDGHWHKVNGLWQFEGRENFFPNQEKESQIPIAFVQNMFENVSDELSAVLATRKLRRGALEGYIRRNVVAHLAIHPTSNWMADPDFENPLESARIFHATRYSIAQDEADSKRLWRVQKLTVPGILKKMIEAVATEKHPREALIKRIQDAKNDDMFLDGFRAKLAEAVVLSTKGNRYEFERLISHLEDLSSEGGFIPECPIILIGEAQYRNAISVLAKMGAGPGGISVNEEAFGRVFPDLIPPLGTTGLKA
jgi:hypothetical protein